MKYLLLLLVIGIALFIFKSRLRGPDKTAARSAPKPGAPHDLQPTPMLACVHCGIHLPQADAVTDAAGQPYCTDAHRLAGPR